MEQDCHVYFDTLSYEDTEGLCARLWERGAAEELAAKLAGALPGLRLLRLRRFFRGSYRGGFLRPRVKRLPPFAELWLEDAAGRRLLCWIPLAWNGRLLLGAPDEALNTLELARSQPDNTLRGALLPKGIMNGFCAGVTEGPVRELARALRFLAEELHGRPVRFTYLQGPLGCKEEILAEDVGRRAAGVDGRRAADVDELRAAAVDGAWLWYPLPDLKTQFFEECAESGVKLLLTPLAPCSRDTLRDCEMMVRLLNLVEENVPIRK